MPYHPSDLVDFAISKELANLETAFADLADLRISTLVDRARENLGKGFSGVDTNHEDSE